MIEKALRYIVGLNEPKILEVNGQTYSDKRLDRIKFHPSVCAIEMSTLTSLVDYVKANSDYMPPTMFVQVVSPTEVLLFTAMDPEEKDRDIFVRVKAVLPVIKMDQWVGHEEFLIALQAKYKPTDDRDLLLKFAGTVENGTVAQYGDDGVSQKATIKTGIASKGDAVVPNPVKLRPYRTFLEVEQPESQFVFRMKDSSSYGENEVKCALFEADGGAWKMQAMKNIKDYLQFELAECFTHIIVLS